MNDPASMRRQQKSVVFVALLLFSLVLLLIQLWLFVSALEEFQVGRVQMAVPAAIASAVILAVNLWMLRGVYVLSKRR